MNEPSTEIPENRINFPPCFLPYVPSLSAGYFQLHTKGAQLSSVSLKIRDPVEAGQTGFGGRIPGLGRDRHLKSQVAETHRRPRARTPSRAGASPGLRGRGPARPRGIRRGRRGPLGRHSLLFLSVPSQAALPACLVTPFRRTGFLGFSVPTNAPQLSGLHARSSREQPRLRRAFPTPNSKFLGKSDWVRSQEP